MHGARVRRGAFTLVELVVVIVVLAILSGVAIPKIVDYTTQARESSIKGTLGAVRSAIATHYAKSIYDGAPAFPTQAYLTTYGGAGLMLEQIPGNPFKDNNAGVRAAAWTSAQQATDDPEGWNYDEATGKFWANSTTNASNTW
jgi:prepilin-type N-terminal cleavage/methylation domain-containing protein